VTQADLDQLQAFSDANNFLGYCSKLSALGDRYASLAIGVAAAMGIALGVRDSRAGNLAQLREEFNEITTTLASTRPTAVNLFWAIERMKMAFGSIIADAADRASGDDVEMGLLGHRGYPFAFTLLRFDQQGKGQGQQVPFAAVTFNKQGVMDIESMPVGPGASRAIRLEDARAVAQ